VQRFHDIAIRHSNVVTCGSDEPFRFAITRMNEMDKIAFSGASDQNQFAFGLSARSDLAPPQ